MTHRGFISRRNRGFGKYIRREGLQPLHAAWGTAAITCGVGDCSHYLRRGGLQPLHAAWGTTAINTLCGVGDCSHPTKILVHQQSRAHRATECSGHAGSVPFHLLRVLYPPCPATGQARHERHGQVAVRPLVDNVTALTW